MKRTVLTITASAIVTVLLFLLLGAAPPAPIWRNNFSTNEPPFPVIGDWNYSNAVPANGTTNYVLWSDAGIAGLINGGAGWRLYPQSASSTVVADFVNGQTAIFTNGGMTIHVLIPDQHALKLAMSGANTYADPLQVLDPSGNFTMMSARTNCFWATTNDYFNTLITADNTTNNIFTLSMRNNSIVRLIVDVVGYNATASASYGKVATFKNVGGSVNQVGSIATVGQAEEDAAYECIVDVSTDIIRVRVAGNTGRTVDWKSYVKTIYSE